MDILSSFPRNPLPGFRTPPQGKGNDVHKGQSNISNSRGEAYVQDSDLSKWYEPGTDDCYYEDAWIANTALKENLTKTHGDMMGEWHRSGSANPLALSAYFEERVELLTGNKNTAKYSKRKEVKDAVKKLGGRLVKLATALDPLILSLLPSSPEYTIPYACLKIILKFITNIAADRAEEISDYVESLGNIFEEMRFQSDMKPTGAMKLLLAKIYVQVLEFLERLVEYSTFPVIEKLRIFVTKSRKEYNFVDRLAKIQDLKKQLEVAADMSIKAMQKEEFLLIREFAAVMPVLYRHSKDIHLATQLSVNSQAISNAHLLISILFPDNDELYEELGLWKKVNFRLSPGDRWHQNGVLKKLELWSKSNDNLFFAVGPCGTKNTWITNFSLDLISMLQKDRETVTFALCDRPFKEKWTPTILTKILIRQLLQQYPMLTLQHPEICNTPTFQRPKEFSQIWKIFSNLIMRLESLYIIVDRLDLCKWKMTKESSEETVLLDNFVKIGRDMGGKVKIILTSATAPKYSTCEKLKLRYTLVDTQKRAKRRLRSGIESEDSDSDTSSLPDD